MDCEGERESESVVAARTSFLFAIFALDEEGVVDEP